MRAGLTAHGCGEAAAGEDTFWAIRRFFEATARERPLALVFDDIHWGETTFLDLVEHIADWSRGSRSCCCAWRAPTCWICGPAGLGETERGHRVAGAPE